MTQEKPESNGTFVSNFSILIRIRGEFSLQQLQQALDRVRARHRLLIPGADDESLASTHFPLRFLANGSDDQAWKEVVKEELRMPFPNGNGPFARFAWLQSNGHSDLIGTFHHGVCDGFSGIYVMRDVLQVLGNPKARVSALPPPAHLIRLIPEAVTTDLRVKWQLRKTVIMTRAALSLGRLSKRITFRPQPAFARSDLSTLGELPLNLRMCILTQTLTDAQTARLIQCCKTEGTTVHAAVCTAWLRAFANTPDGTNHRIRSVSSPVSLRNRLTQPVDETAGMFLSTVETSLHCKPGTDFWTMAREFHTRFKHDSTDEKVFMMPLMFGAFAQSFSKAEMGEAIRSFFSGPVKYDFSITNLGRLDFPTQAGSLQVESLYNLVNSSEHERTVGVNTFDGRMTFIFIFRESKMTSQAGEQLMTQAIRELADVSGW